MKGKIVLALLLALVTAFATTVASADHSWGPSTGYHWHIQTALVKDQVGPEYNMPAALAEWNAISPWTDFQLAQGKVDIRIRKFNNSNLLGQITIRTSGLIINSAVIKLNTSALQAIGPDALDSVLCHELGHAQGLDHPPDPPTSCMTNSPTTFPVAPDAHDAEQLLVNYGHLLGSSSLGARGTGPHGHDGKPGRHTISLFMDGHEEHTHGP